MVGMGEAVSPKSSLMLDSLREVVPPARFQRATFRLGGGRSMQLSYGSLKGKNTGDRRQKTGDRRQEQGPLLSTVF